MSARPPSLTTAEVTRFVGVGLVIEGMSAVP